MIIAIDGPAGAGKSTVAGLVAKSLNFQWIDTGALYRVVTYQGLQQGLSLENEGELVEIAKNAKFSFKWIKNQNTLLYNGEKVGDEIRSERVSSCTSRVATFPSIRKALVEVAQQLGEKQSSVLEGRDIGTVVFPNAEVKIYLDASSEIRAKRRVEQAAERGEILDFQEVKVSIIERDKRDMMRKVTPLRCADDAIRIDSSTLSIEEVVEKILELAKEKLSRSE